MNLCTGGCMERERTVQRAGGGGHSIEEGMEAE